MEVDEAAGSGMGEEEREIGKQEKLRGVQKEREVGRRRGVVTSCTGIDNTCQIKTTANRDK